MKGIRFSIHLTFYIISFLAIDREPILCNYYFSSILSHDSMGSALANHISMKLSDSSLPSGTLYDLFVGFVTEDQEIIIAVKDDLTAVKEGDHACISYVHCFLNFKGFLANLPWVSKGYVHCFKGFQRVFS